MSAKKTTTLSEKDEIPYPDVYRTIKENTGNIRVSEAKKPDWKNPLLVRFFQRLGTVPKTYAPSRAALRILLAVKEMAEKTGVPTARVYGELMAFCRDDGTDGICAARPRCTICPVAEHCKFASSGPGLKDLPATERPRERLLNKGADNLKDAELLAILIGGGSREESALALAQRLLATFGDMKGVSQAGNGELRKIKGIGDARTARLHAAFEIATRLQSTPLQPGMSIKGSSHVFGHFKERLQKMKKEAFICLLLDTRHNVIREEKVAVGSLNESIVHPREVFRTAVNESAHAVLFVHNHPSGNPSPSPQDKKLTERLKKAGDVMGIRVIDHLIVGDDSYYSFAEHRQL